MSKQAHDVLKSLELKNYSYDFEYIFKLIKDSEIFNEIVIKKNIIFCKFIDLQKKIFPAIKNLDTILKSYINISSIISPISINGNCIGLFVVSSDFIDGKYIRGINYFSNIISMNLSFSIKLKKTINKLKKKYFLIKSDNKCNKNINLTQRELEICKLIKEGYKNKEISDILFISLSTVERHRYNIRKKLKKYDNSAFNLYTFLSKKSEI